MEQRLRFVLNDQQKEIAALLCQGKQNKEIAHDVRLAERTIKWHITQLFRKCHVSTRVELVALLLSDQGSMSR
jgi:two-component system response regulator DegU